MSWSIISWCRHVVKAFSMAMKQPWTKCNVSQPLWWSTVVKNRPSEVKLFRRNEKYFGLLMSKGDPFLGCLQFLYSPVLEICDKACNSSSKCGINFAIESTNVDKNEFKVSDFWLAFLQSKYDSHSRHKSSYVSRWAREEGMPCRTSCSSLGSQHSLAVSGQHCA